jgi:hypothetical protein
MTATRTHVVKNLRHPLMSFVTLPLLDANVQHHFATSCMDITGYALALSIHSYQLLTFHVPQKVCNFLGFKARSVFQVGHCAQLPVLCSFCLCICLKSHPWTLQPCRIIYQQLLKFWVQHLENVLLSTLVLLHCCCWTSDLTLKIPHTWFCLSESQQTCFT